MHRHLAIILFPVTLAVYLGVGLYIWWGIAHKIETGEELK